MTTTKAICVWLDNTSDANYEAWIVSLDEIELPSGKAATTQTLKVLDTEADALDVARREAAKRRLPLYRNDEGSAAELLEASASESAAEARGEYSELRTAIGFNPAFEAATTAESQAREASGYYDV